MKLQKNMIVTFIFIIVIILLCGFLVTENFKVIMFGDTDGSLKYI